MLIFDWSKKINSKELSQVVEALNENKIVIFPTETVYGIGGNAFSLEVIDKLFKSKKRSEQKPISVLVKNKDNIKNIAYVNAIEQKIIDKFMPGSLTLILKKKDVISDKLTAGLDTVGLRIPSNGIALEILNNIDYPLATSSANIAGEKNINDINHLIEEFKENVAIIIKGNVSDDLLASTVALVDDDNIKILREGKVSLVDLQNTIKKI